MNAEDIIKTEAQFHNCFFRKQVKEMDEHWRIKTNKELMVLATVSRRKEPICEYISNKRISENAMLLLQARILEKIQSIPLDNKEEK